MKKLFSKKVAFLSTLVICSFSLMSFSENENLYGTSKETSVAVDISIDGPKDAEFLGVIVRTARYAYAVTRAICPHAVRHLNEATRYATCFARNNNDEISKKIFANSIQRIQLAKFKKLG